MKFFAALTTLVALAIASPVEVAVRKDDSLEKRDTEIVYLVNCRHITSCCGPETHSSQIAYYGASGQSHNGETPATNNVCTVDSSNYAWWEQDGKKCSFPTGVTFTSHIDSNAQSHALYSWSGWGSNGFKNWDCYRDDGHKLYEYSGPEWATICSSVYYCTPQ